MAGNNDELMNIAKLVGAGADAGQGVADYSAGRANAKLLEMQAAMAVSDAAAREAVTRDETAQIIGQQIANVGASGLTYDGSPMDVIRQNAVEREMEALNERYAGTVKQVGFMSQAAEARREATQALYGGIAKGGASLLLAGAAQQQTQKTKQPTPVQVALTTAPSAQPRLYADPPAPRFKPLLGVQ
jgi:hypothetical protein